MARIGEDALRQVLDALEDYENIVNNTPLAPTSKSTYLLHANHFVRWLQDDFDPGASLIERERQRQPGIRSLRETFGN